MVDISKIQPDKVKHFVACLIICVVSGLAVSTYGEELGAIVGPIVSLVAGVAKEIYDHYNGGESDMKDLIWDFFGSLTGLGVLVLIFII